MKDDAVADDHHILNGVRSLNLDLNLRILRGCDFFPRVVPVDLKAQHNARVGHGVIAAAADG